MAVSTSSLDYNELRIALVREITLLTGLTCVLTEPESQQAPRPDLPYFGFKITTPGLKYGSDDKQQVLDTDGNPTTRWLSHGHRKMTVSFQVYGTSHEEAYNYMGFLQAALDLADVQNDLRAVGLAVWSIGTVTDISQLLNTEYEGRAQMDVQFGIAMNVSSDLGQISQIPIQGNIPGANVTEVIKQPGIREPI